MELDIGSSCDPGTIAAGVKCCHARIPLAGNETRAHKPAMPWKPEQRRCGSDSALAGGLKLNLPPVTPLRVGRRSPIYCRHRRGDIAGKKLGPPDTSVGRSSPVSAAGAVMVGRFCGPVRDSCSLALPAWEVSMWSLRAQRGGTTWTPTSGWRRIGNAWGRDIPGTSPRGGPDGGVSRGRVGRVGGRRGRAWPGRSARRGCGIRTRCGSGPGSWCWWIRLAPGTGRARGRRRWPRGV